MTPEAANRSGDAGGLAEPMLVRPGGAGTVAPAEPKAVGPVAAFG
eukprot:CAMPEP_0204571528 /NCGR_PEP_ID=MMETSP0661-20131031/38941_1 /ASSEMBLY_ACC=CAM_ASM_000606 /TAXON_ID=109239 /ORGANISM="Alexandrium margalefi, Strain AMGDE01CS-322" /LENGTH=44 /DNA_ID= /DNA_START= /DNA_END= /DNA_ORIENTATION=